MDTVFVIFTVAILCWLAYRIGHRNGLRSAGVLTGKDADRLLDELKNTCSPEESARRIEMAKLWRKSLLSESSSHLNVPGNPKLNPAYPGELRDIAEDMVEAADAMNESRGAGGDLGAMADDVRSLRTERLRKKSWSDTKAAFRALADAEANEKPTDGDGGGGTVG